MPPEVRIFLFVKNKPYKNYNKSLLLNFNIIDLLSKITSKIFFFSITGNEHIRGC